MKISFNYMKEFLIDALEEEDFDEDDYKLSDFYKEAFLKKLSKDFPDYYFRVNHGDFVNESLGYTIREGEPYEKAKEDFENFLAQSGGEDTAILKTRLSYAWRDVGYKGAGEFYLSNAYGLNNFAELFTILQYVRNGIIEKDRAFSLDMVKRYNLGGLGVNSFDNTYFKEFTLSIKAYKNGKVVVKGLSKDDLATLDYLKEILK